MRAGTRSCDYLINYVFRSAVIRATKIVFDRKLLFTMHNLHSNIDKRGKRNKCRTLENANKPWNFFLYLILIMSF